jgi:glutathione S-transferase
MIEIFGAAQSVYVRATRLALEEKGVPYTLTPVAPHSSQVLAINPFGKIPVMRHGDFELFESLAIMVYVDRAFCGASLIPADARVAARIVQWACAINACVLPALLGYMQANAFPKGPNEAPDAAVVAGFLPALHANVAILERAVAPTGHLAGEAFTIADMYLMPILGYLRVFPESAKAVAGATNLTQYFERHAARASFQATAPPPLAALQRS